MSPIPPSHEGLTSGNVTFLTVWCAVAGSIDMGVGHSGLVKLCRFLNMASVHHKTSARHSRAICDANKIAVNRLFVDAERVIHRVYHELDPLTGLDDTIDLNVSFDGLLMTHGHNSQYGIGCVVEVVTGLVLNLAVMSLYCQRCAYASTQYGGKDTDDFKTWFKTHEPECNQNYHGSKVWHCSRRDRRYTRNV